MSPGNSLIVPISPGKPVYIGNDRSPLTLYNANIGIIIYFDNRLTIEPLYECSKVGDRKPYTYAYDKNLLWSMKRTCKRISNGISDEKNVLLWHDRAATGEAAYEEASRLYLVAAAWMISEEARRCDSSESLQRLVHQSPDTCQLIHSLTTEFKEKRLRECYDEQLGVWKAMSAARDSETDQWALYAAWFKKFTKKQEAPIGLGISNVEFNNSSRIV